MDRQRSRRFGGRAAKIVLLAGTLVILVAAFEIGLRVVGYQPRTATTLDTFFEFDSVTGWRGRRNVHSRFATNDFDCMVTHAASGFRASAAEDEVGPAETQPGKVTWCVGDSMTWGWGVEDGETIVDALNRSAPIGNRFRNLGICGYSTVQEYLLLEDLLAKEPKPDRVLLFFVANDLYENVDAKDMDPPRPYLEPQEGGFVLRNSPVPAPEGWRLHPWLNRNVLAYNFLYFSVVNARSALRNLRGSGRLNVPAPYPEEQWLALGDALARIRDLCSRCDVELSVVYLPGLGEIGDRRYEAAREFEDARRKRFFDLAEELSLSSIDPTSRFHDHFADDEKAARVSFETDTHLNAKGNELAAEAVLTKLETQNKANDKSNGLREAQATKKF